MSTTGFPLSPCCLYAHCMPFHSYVTSSETLSLVGDVLLRQRNGRLEAPSLALEALYFLWALGTAQTARLRAVMFVGLFGEQRMQASGRYGWQAGKPTKHRDRTT
mmetsp:Transcript_6687/g.16605  ORF Transcript_6687/g.16605 Transcript_6687/m.16605 type:complete len:105 (-) Transcript_6687:128-442(-)